MNDDPLDQIVSELLELYPFINEQFYPDLNDGFYIIPCSLQWPSEYPDPPEIPVLSASFLIDITEIKVILYAAIEMFDSLLFTSLWDKVCIYLKEGDEGSGFEYSENGVAVRVEYYNMEKGRALHNRIKSALKTKELSAFL